MAKRGIVYQGTELKLNVHIEPVGTMSMEEYDFVCTAFCSVNKKVIATKEECIKVDKDNYLLLVDTNLTGCGDLFIKVEAYLPDDAFVQSDNLRTEVDIVDTGLTIVSKYTR